MWHLNGNPTAYYPCSLRSAAQRAVEEPVASVVMAALTVVAVYTHQMGREAKVEAGRVVEMVERTEVEEEAVPRVVVQMVGRQAWEKVTEAVVSSQLAELAEWVVDVKAVALREEVGEVRKEADTAVKTVE